VASKSPKWGRQNDFYRAWEELAIRIALAIACVVLMLLAGPLLLRFRPRWVAKFNLAVTNRITGRFAAWLPGFGILTHRGRKSGRRHRTPVNVFPASGGFAIALTYGPASQWVRNVLASGEGELETRRVRYQLFAPVIVHDPTRRQFPILVRLVLRIVGASDFMRVSSRKLDRQPKAPDKP
jgi:deazaflavin-dependent oxidoreductase (nitroreductase family)